MWRRGEKARSSSVGPSSSTPLYVSPAKECAAMEGSKQGVCFPERSPWLLCGKCMEVEGSGGRETGQVAVAINQVEVSSITLVQG